MQKKNSLSVKTVVAIGIGTAIIFILKRWVSIPSGIPNTNIDTSYGFLGFFSSYSDLLPASCPASSATR